MTRLPRGRRPHARGVRRGARRRAVRGSASPSQVPQVLDGPRRGAAVREAVGPDARRRPRWRSSASAATRSTSGPTRSGSASASPSPTSPARSPAYCAVIAARVFDHATLEDDGAGGRRAGREPALRPRAPVPGARRLPHVPRAASATSKAAGSCTSATATTSPRRSPSPPRSPASSSRSRRRRATSSTTTPSSGRATSAARSSSSPIPYEAVQRRRRGLHRRVDVDGPGRGVGDPPGRVRGLHGRRRR